MPVDSAAEPRIVLYSAPGHVPVVQALRAIPDPAAVVALQKDPDPRGGFLVGVVFHKNDAAKDSGACSIDSFTAGQEVVINRARARTVVTTNNLGSFIEKLPAGEYQVHVAGQTQTVEVPRSDTRLVVMALEPLKRMEE